MQKGGRLVGSKLLVVLVSVLVLLLTYMVFASTPSLDSVNLPSPKNSTNWHDEIVINFTTSTITVDNATVYIQAGGESDFPNQFVLNLTPTNLESCHTTIVEGYVIEGHIPVEVINKLLKEKPDIKGIAMPGMPSGSPGMPGQKRGEWIIHAMHHDGSTTEYMRI